MGPRLILIVVVLAGVAATATCLETTAQVTTLGSTAMEEFIEFAGRTVTTSTSGASAVHVTTSSVGAGLLDDDDDAVVAAVLSLDPESAVAAPSTLDPLPSHFAAALTVAAEDEADFLDAHCPTGTSCANFLIVTPVAASFLVPVVHLTGYGDTLVTSPQLLIWMWDGTIDNWSHTALQLLNSHTSLPNATIHTMIHDAAVIDKILGHLQHRIDTAAAQGDYDPIVEADPALAADLARQSATRRTARRTAHARGADLIHVGAAEAAAETLHTAGAFTLLTSETYDEGWGGVLDVPRIQLSHGDPIRMSRGSVLAEVDALDSKDLAALLSGVEDGWPLTFLEWMVLPKAVTGVPPSLCTDLANVVTVAHHLVSSLFISDRAWEHGHVGFPIAIREYVAERLESVSCNGVDVVAHDRLVHGAGKSLVSKFWLSGAELFNILNSATVRYNPSADGLDGVIDHSIVYGGIDKPPSADELDDAPGLMVLPIGATAVALPYSIKFADSAPPSLPDLVLDSDAVAKIFMAQVTQWDDPVIAGLNPELAPHLPNATICMYVLSSKSGLTLGLTKALSAASDAWANSFGETDIVPPGFWPGEALGTAGCVRRKSDVVDIVRAIASSDNVIGYADVGHVADHSLVSAQMINPAGALIKPGVASTAAALAAVQGREPADPDLPFVQDLINTDHVDAWPIVMPAYVATLDGANDYCMERGVFGSFYSWMITSHDAQLSAAHVGIATLPNVTASAALTAIRAARCGAGLVINPCEYTECAPVVPSDTAALSTGHYLAIAAGLVVLLACVVVGFLMYIRQRDVVFKLAVDEDLVIPLEELEVMSVLGTGSFGTVYKVKWRGTPIAVKHMHGLEADHTKLAEFVDEASVLMKLRHPNILLFMGITLDPAGLVTEYMPNGSLYSVLHDYDLNLEPNLVMWWAHSIALGMDFLHHSGIVHRDMKSLNILLDAGYAPKICDFGLSASSDTSNQSAASRKAARRAAKKLKQLRKNRKTSSRVGSINSFGSASSNPFGTSASGLSSAGSSAGSSLNGSSLSPSNDHGDGNLGSLLWAAPEILNEGSTAAAQPSDVYAYAVTLWEMVTRSEPYAGSNPVTVAVEVSLGSARPDLATVPDWAVSTVPLITAGWDQNAAARPTFATLATQLASKYLHSKIVLPRKTETPSGRMVVGRVSVAHLLKGSTVEVAGAHAMLSDFHVAISEALVASKGTRGDTTLTDVVVLFQVPTQALTFVEALVLDLGHVPFKMALSLGGLVTQESTGSIPADKHKSFTGDAIISLQSCWRSSPVAGRDSGVFVAQSLVPDLSGALRAAKDTRLVMDIARGFALLRSISAAGLYSARHDKGAGNGSSSDISSDDLGPLRTVSMLVTSGRKSGTRISSDSSAHHETMSGMDCTITTTAASFTDGLGEASLALPPAYSPTTPGTPSTPRILSSTSTSTLALWSETPQPFLLAVPTLRAVVQRGVHAGISSYAKILISDYQGARVCVKLLMEQSLPTSALVDFACGIARVSALAAELPPDVLLEPLAVCTTKPFVAVVLPFCEGGSLADVVGDTGVDGATIKALLVSTAQALGALHNAGSAHGCIKPTNVMLRRANDTEVVLSDAGLADIKSSMSTMTMSPSVSFLCPEVLRGEAAAAPADVFSFASVVYEVITGHAAFSGVNAMQVAHKIRLGKLPDLERISSKRLVTLLRACWSVDPSARPPSATVISSLTALDAFDFVAV